HLVVHVRTTSFGRSGCRSLTEDFFCSFGGDLSNLHSFPTRRSSDLWDSRVPGNDRPGPEPNRVLSLSAGNEKSESMRAWNPTGRKMVPAVIMTQGNTPMTGKSSAVNPWNTTTAA